MQPYEFIAISSEGTRSGKTELRKFLGRHFNVRHGSTSDIIIPRYAHMEGLPVWRVFKDRETDPHAHREGLIAEGDLMRSEGRPPGLAAMILGFQVVDGIRSPAEMEAIQSWAYAAPAHVYHLHILGRRDEAVIDNTDAVGLLSLAPHVLHNDGTLDDLFLRAVKLLDIIGLR